MMMTTDRVKAIREDLETAMKKLGEKHDVMVTQQKRVCYDDKGFPLRLTFTANAEGGTIRNPELDEWVDRSLDALKAQTC